MSVEKSLAPTVLIEDMTIDDIGFAMPSLSDEERRRG
jgi:hypothetical protein